MHDIARDPQRKRPIVSSFLLLLTRGKTGRGGTARFHKSDKPEPKQVAMSCRIFRTVASQHCPMLQPRWFTECCWQSGELRMKSSESTPSE